MDNWYCNIGNNHFVSKMNLEIKKSAEKDSFMLTGDGIFIRMVIVNKEENQVPKTLFNWLKKWNLINSNKFEDYFTIIRNDSNVKNEEIAKQFECLL